ncbi:MAG: ATP-binding protein [Burkholderiaceae bacterium]
MMRARVGLRVVLVLAIAPMLLLPWIGLRFVEEMAGIARDERLDTLTAASRSLAVVLHERAELFDSNAAPGDGQGRPTALALPAELLARVDVDGHANEWLEASRRPLATRVLDGAPPSTLRVRLAVARSQEQAGRRFVLVDVDDERFIAPSPQHPAETTDSLLIEAGQGPDAMHAVPATIAARPGGWSAEAEIAPQARLLRVVVKDVDYQGSRKVEALAESGLLSLAADASDAVVKAREQRWATTIAGLERSSGRVSVFDAGGALLVQRGELTVRDPGPRDWGARLARWLLATAERLRPWLKLPFDTTGETDEAAQGELSPLAKALAGVPARRAIRLGMRAGMPVWQLTAAQPVWIGDHVVGALVLAETTGARFARGQASLERFTLLVAAAMIATLTALLLVGSATVSRIRHLRRAAEDAIDARGRVVGTIPRFRLRDEIGELASGYERVLERLREHQDYLAKLRSRLVHELRTPIMVVRSSLENLADESEVHRRAAYAQRAQEGAARLERIVSSMGEASSLETMLADSTLERIDLLGLVIACVDGYRGAYPQRRFSIDASVAGAPAAVVPEAIAQALDKLAANAADFATEGSPVVVRLHADGTAWRLAVENQGPALPAAMGASLFDSMVSVREARGDARGHLGLGLYLVRLVAEFHGGRVFAENRPGGVAIGFTVPMLRDALPNPAKRRASASRPPSTEPAVPAAGAARADMGIRGESR